MARAVPAAPPGSLLTYNFLKLLPLLLPVLFVHLQSSLALSAASSSVIRVNSLSGSEGTTLCQCAEVVPPPSGREEEDEVELWYPTKRRTFAFRINGVDGEIEGEEPFVVGSGDESEGDVTIRQTTFGCGRLGATVWPSAIALSSYLFANPNVVRGKRVLELGAGCGLPTAVCRELCGASSVLATDFWEEEGGSTTGERLVPDRLFGMNLAHNVGGWDNVRKLDWHITEDVMGLDYCPDIIVGSDLIYYPYDVDPFLETLSSLLLPDSTSSNKGATATGGVFFFPLPPAAEREALPDFRSKLEGGYLGECNIKTEEMILDRGNGERETFLAVLASVGEDQR